VVLGMAAWMLFSPFVNFTDVAAESAAGLVVAAVEATGGAAIGEDAALVAYAAQRPGFVAAALRDGVVLPGSDPVLARALAALGPALPRRGQLELDLPQRGLTLFAQMDSGVGPLVVVTAGNRFLAQDTPAFFAVFLWQTLQIFAPALLCIALVIPFAIARGLRPVRRAAAAAAEVDLRSLDRRLPDAGVPGELLPFVTAINDLLARLEEGVKRQRLFTANAAHELRTPVAILRARLDGLPPDAPGRTDLLRDTQRITLLLDQLLAVARLDAREAALDEAIDLPAMVRALVADCAPLAIRAGRQIALSAEPVAPIRGNQRALESAVANLIDNALRAEPPGGTVQVAVGPGARVDVADHGAGVAPDDRAAVFEPFWRKDEASRGTGLGLAIVRDVARRHGGDVAVEDTPGGGATFRLDLVKR
jgi:signal transduction histidine kinase